MSAIERRLARWLGYRGPVDVLDILPRRPSLIVLNYHRIGSAANQPFDHGVFSATEAEFRHQLEILQSRYHVVTLKEAIRCITGDATLSRDAVLITFDDGYRDNYDIAFPILKAMGVPATFFLVSDMVGTREPPWWDQIAYVVRHAKNRRFTMDYPVPRTFDLDGSGMNVGIRQVLDTYKANPTLNHHRFMDSLEAACGAERPVPNERLFLGWDEAQTMLSAGMNIGSHSKTHRLMARLPVNEQIDEARLSREAITEQLGISVEAFAYPVGRETTFSAETMKAVEGAGYRAGFSFCGGVNRIGSNLFDLRRLDSSVLSDLATFRGRLAIAALFGR